MKFDPRFFFIVILIGLLLATIFWIQDTLAYVVVLGLANVVALWMLHRSDLIMVYLFIFLGAVLSEVVMIFMGVWDYTQVHILGFPVWLPFFWFSGIVFVGSMVALLWSKKLRTSDEQTSE